MNAQGLERSLRGRMRRRGCTLLARSEFTQEQEAAAGRIEAQASTGQDKTAAITWALVSPTGAVMFVIGGIWKAEKAWKELEPQLDRLAVPDDRRAAFAIEVCGDEWPDLSGLTLHCTWYAAEGERGSLLNLDEVTAEAESGIDPSEAPDDAIEHARRDTEEALKRFFGEWGISIKPPKPQDYQEADLLLRELHEWGRQTGGWEGPCWERLAHYLRDRSLLTAGVVAPAPVPDDLAVTAA